MTSRILIAYASKHGATRQIAERIATTLTASGHQTEVLTVQAATDLSGYDAFIIGSAVYYGSWLKEATEFVRGNSAVLVGRPVWLFSSGPLGTAATDDEGRDLREVGEPKQIAELKATINARDHRVFFGVLDPGTLGFTERMVRVLPAGRALLPEGDFRDWQEIESWAVGIARELAPMPVEAL